MKATVTQKNKGIHSPGKFSDSAYLKDKDPFPQLGRGIEDGLVPKRYGIHALLQMIKNNHKITSLDLSKMCIGPVEIHHLANAICESIWIKKIDLSENRLTDEAGKIIAGIIKSNDALIWLNLSHNQLEETGSQYIGQALCSNNSIETLDLSWNHIRLKGAVTLCNGLLENRYIQRVNISSNGFGYDGSVALSRVLKHNRVLKEIDISDNRICWDGALILSKGLRLNKTLEILKLRRNPLTTTGCMDILEAITTDGNAIQMLDLQGIPVISEFQYLAAALKKQRNFTCLYGNIVNSHDYLGRRKACLINPMDTVIDYIKRTDTRPLELLRCFDKPNNWTIAKQEFIARLKKCGITLHEFEMKQVTDEIRRQSTQEEKDITYRNFIRAMSDRTLAIRREKLADIKQKRKLKIYHERILNPVTPKDNPEEVLTQNFWRPELPACFAGSRSELIHGSANRLSDLPKLEVKEKKKKKTKTKTENNQSEFDLETEISLN